MPSAAKKLRGVNLGGWLVLEKWMTPSLFAGLAAEDETAWCLEMGAAAEPRLKQHWQTFIKREDFDWLAQRGINAVRIPVGHWLFGPDYPYHPRFAEHRYPYVNDGLEVLDQAFAWAQEFGLLIMLDLHAAPGCQNGFDNGGIKDVCDWHTQAAYLQHSLAVLEKLAARYHLHPALHGIEVLNEPHQDIASAYLMTFTHQAYQRIRQYCSADQVAVVFHDGFRSYQHYTELLQASTYQNLIFDIHRYQCFTLEDLNSDIYTHIRKAVSEWKTEADDIIRHAGRNTIVGEWSLGLDPRMLELWQQDWHDVVQPTMDKFQQNVAYRGYAASQLACFEKYLGWFFWSYRTETMPQWSFRDCVENGWLPTHFS